MGIPVNFRIELAMPQDLTALARLHVCAFQETHGGGPAIDLRLAQWTAHFASGEGAFCLVVRRDDELVGFAKGEPRSESELPEFAGELDKIYLLREVQGIGLGKRLLCMVAQEFVRREINSMVLFGDSRSQSNGFYERMGGERLYDARGCFHGGYGWRDLGALRHDHCHDCG
jgi:GNAT superfamily N-acetyltransferase